MRLSLGTRELAEGDDVAVFRRGAGATRLVALRWGMLSPWSGHGGKRGPIRYVAPVAALAALPLFRTSFEKRRCIVVADGIVEGRHWIHARPPRPLGLGAIWSMHEDDGRESVALLVQPAPAELAAVTEVVPVVVDASWLASVEAARTALAAPPIAWRAMLRSQIGSAQGELF